MITDARPAPTCPLCRRTITYVQRITPGIVCELLHGAMAHMLCAERWMSDMERDIDAAFGDYDDGPAAVDGRAH